MNLVGRGTIAPPVQMPLCEKAQEEFNAFVSIPVVLVGQLYGGKICAALDRQHPRDLFDVQHLLANDGITNDLKAGFILCLLSSDRPIHELLAPHLLDQRSVLENQFTGMTTEPFSYSDFETTRERLIVEIHAALSQSDRLFLLSVNSGVPDWSIYDYQHFPAVQWKLQNLQKLKTNNPEKHKSQHEALEQVLQAGEAA